MRINANMYESIENGDNIHKVIEFNPINNTLNVIKKISNNEYTNSDLKKLVKEIGKVQVKVLDRGENLSTAINKVFRTWDMNSSPIEDGEESSMGKLNKWQNELVIQLKEMPSTMKVVFNNMKSHWEIVIIVDVASAKLTYEYSKLFNSFRKMNDDVQFDFFVISNSSYINEESTGITVRLK